MAIDPSGKTGGVYLVNDTGKPLENVVRELTKCVLEAKIDGTWQRCEPVEPVCLSVEAPRALPPRKAMFLSALSANKGDQEAEMRYVVLGGAFVSPSFRGRYSSRDWAQAALLEALLEKSWGKLPHARGPEELVALFELDRHYEDFRMGLSPLKSFAEAMPFQENEKARFQESVARVFARSKPGDLGEAAFFERCVTALSAPRSKKHAYGSPENCRRLVWRRLCSPPAASPFIGGKTETEAEAVLASGNPWGVGKDRLTVLIDLTVKALSSDDVYEKREAGAFLGMPWIREEYFPKGSIDKLLELNFPAVQKAAAAIRERSKNSRPAP